MNSVTDERLLLHTGRNLGRQFGLGIRHLRIEPTYKLTGYVAERAWNKFQNARSTEEFTQEQRTSFIVAFCEEAYPC